MVVDLRKAFIWNCWYGICLWNLGIQVEYTKIAEMVKVSWFRKHSNSGVRENTWKAAGKERGNRGNRQQGTRESRESAELSTKIQN